jgi:glycosyltransferase involved in cell wall biosynthesis
LSPGPIEAADVQKARPAGSSAPHPSPNTILYVVGSLDVGGTERHLALVAPRLKQLGWALAVYCLSRPGQQASEVAEAGVRVIFPPVPSSLKQERGVTGVARLALSALKLFWVMLKMRPRIVHLFLPGAYLLGGPLALFTRIPNRIMSRRSLNNYQADHPIIRKCELRLHRHMTAILGNSRSVVRELVDEGCPPERVALIYNGIDISAFETRRERDNPLVLVTVANLIRYKGHSGLLNALGDIAGELPPGWSLLCVGRDDEMGAALRRRSRELGIEENVTFLGVRSDIPALLGAADIGILASHQEGFANSILEGMAAGLPMVVTNVGGNAEAVINGVTGLVVPPRDEKELGRAILQLARDRALRRKFGEAGRKRVENYFDIDRCVANYSRLYTGVLEGKLPAEIVGATPPT